MENSSADIEHISYWLKKNNKFAASSCSCRPGRKRMGECCGDSCDNWCIAIGYMADHVVETGKGSRYISNDEVLESLGQHRTK